ncbi:GNAT family N-acetyltransferase [Cohnella endophytica]|uniref:GNAT family N-acetyltransferase n=1 Tax=Cohnella endophytica TaxID=2419778 RepID=A0A494X523_9BACL|nr:GNAT family N-acetyltransferase [Cohnella endophytica]RKP45798.1 GNAT family N-acetyltransferase [Cohnella endophytica]
MEIISLDIKDRDTAEAIWALQHPAYRSEAALIGVTDLPPLRDTVESLQACGETFLGCRDEDGELNGAISYEQDSDSAEPDHYTICRLMVHPDVHRQGIGRKLLDRLLSERPPGSRWTVTAEIRNTPALSLYGRFGFVARDSFKPIPDIELLRLVRMPLST